MNKNKELALTISYTKFTDVDMKTAKSYDLIDGELVKSTCGSFWNGSFETICIPIAELADNINSMESGEFVVQGINETLMLGNCPYDATRTKELFPFSDKAGLLIIDSDSIDKFHGITCNDDLIAAFNILEPALAEAMKFSTSSASSYVNYNGISSGLRGVHTYIPVNTAKYNRTIIEILHARSVIAGFAYPKITKSGAIKINSLIDTALKTSNQPVFEGGAILNHTEITQEKKSTLYDGGVLITSDIKPLSDKEKFKYNNIVTALRMSVSDQANAIRPLYLSEKSRLIKNVNPDISDNHAKNIARKATTDNDLYGQFLIRLETGEVITVQAILDDPKKYHQVACADPLDEDVFGKSLIYSDQSKPVIHTFSHGEEVYYLHGDVAEWEIALLDHVDLFNKTHNQVIHGGKHRIARLVDAKLHPENRVTYEFLSIDELKKIYANDLIQTGEKGIEPVYKDKISAWAYHRKCCVYTGGVVFKPAQIIPENFYNLWKGFAIEPKSGASISLINEHIEHVICNNEPDLIQYFKDWVAYSMQHPEVPVGSALVLRGEKGSGKGIIGHLLRKIWGQHSMHISNSTHFVGKFNSHLADLCFLFADEAFYSGDKQHESVLKALITEPVITIERKGIDSVSQPNFLKVFMATNSNFAVPATKDERRYGVFDVSSARINDNVYFRALAIACNDKEVQSAFLDEMLNRDVSKFSANAIPETQGLKDQRLHSLPAHGQWIADSLIKGYFQPKYLVEYSETLAWKTEMTINALHASYLDWCNTNRKTKFDMIQIPELGKYLKNIYVSKKLKGDMRGYVFGNLDAAILAFQNYEKVDLGINVNPQMETLPDWFNDLTTKRNVTDRPFTHDLIV